MAVRANPGPYQAAGTARAKGERLPVAAGRRTLWHHDGMDLDIPLPVIGIVHTSHAELEATPIQAGLNRAEQGTIEIADRYQEGLDGLAEFDFAWLMTWLHRLAEPGTDSVPDAAFATLGM